MGNWWKRLQRRNDPLRCDVCDSSENEGMLVGIRVTTSAAELQNYVRNGLDERDMPRYMRPRLLTVCSGHNEAEEISAGIIPFSLYDRMANLKEALDTWKTHVHARLDNS